MPENSKPWWQSKTNWLHILSILVIGLEMNFHLLEPHLGEQTFAYWALLVNLLGMLVRGVTKTSVTLK